MLDRPLSLFDTTMQAKRPKSRKNREAPQHSPRAAWRDRLYHIIFEADTRSGQIFDITLLIAILLSITTISLETVAYFEENANWRIALTRVEWVLTILFTAEYLARLICVEKPLRYAFSFFGIIDLIACLPMYLTLFSLQPQSLMIFRAVRLLRVFRVLKMMRMLKEAHTLREAVWRARDKILVFLATVLVAVTISGTLMYQIEHGVNKEFSSIPAGMYWAIVTITTVGYGDIKPVTALGQFLSSVVILLGYSLIIVPSSFVIAEIADGRNRDLNARACPHCLREGHSSDAAFCDMCGERLLGEHNSSE